MATGQVINHSFAGRLEAHKRIIRAVKPHKLIDVVMQELQEKRIEISKRKLQNVRKAAKHAAFVIANGVDCGLIKINHAASANRFYNKLTGEKLIVYGEQDSTVPASTATATGSIFVDSMNKMQTGKSSSLRVRSMMNYNRVFDSRKMLK